MDFLELIQTRRTIKEFLPRFVDWDQISKIIDAGRHAPSCGNLQNWRFIVVVDDGIRQKLAEAAFQQYEIVSAPVHIIVCVEPEKAERYYGSRGNQLYSIQNGAAAIENMLLAAHSLGLGAKWVGAFEEDTIKKLLSIPEEVRPQAIVAIGYPKEIPPKPPKLPLETVTYFNRWRNKIRDPSKYMQDYSVIIQRKLNALKQQIKKPLSHVVEKAKNQFK